MNLISFTAVGIRFLSLLLFFYVLRDAIRMISFASILELYQEWPIALFMSSVMLAIAIVLWRFCVTIAKKIIPKEISDIETQLEDFHRPIYQLAIVLFGLYVAIYGLSDLIYTAQVYLSIPDNIVNPDTVYKQKAVMFASLVEIVIGIVLIIGAKGVSKLIYKVRYGY